MTATPRFVVLPSDMWRCTHRVYNRITGQNVQHCSTEIDAADLCARMNGAKPGSRLFRKNNNHHPHPDRAIAEV